MFPTSLYFAFLNLADHRDVLSPDLSRSSTSRSDLLKLPKLFAELRFIV